MKVVRILLLLLIALSCQPAFGQVSASKTARERAGWLGPVAKVKVESTYLKREEGRVIESERVLHEEWVYDRAGGLVIQKTNISERSLTSSPVNIPQAPAAEARRSPDTVHVVEAGTSSLGGWLRLPPERFHLGP